MDNGTGRFEEIDKELFEKRMKESEPYVFKVGEILDIKGSIFKVKSILTNGELRLKLLKNEEARKAYESEFDKLITTIKEK